MMLALRSLAQLAAEPVLPHLPGSDTGWSLVKADVECNSLDRSFGKVDSANDCANKCLEDKHCRFFIFGTAGTKLGDCYSENTATAECAEGWEDDTFDFYRVHAPWVGCMEPRAANYKSTATVDDGSCEEWDTCAETGSRNFDDHAWRTQHCDDWRDWCRHPCEAPGNDGYRNKHNDTVYAQRVAPGELQIDGDLSDWTMRHDPARCYTDVSFADGQGREAQFESYGGGKWFGPTDFSMRWMLAYDDDNFYVGADVTDDVFAVGEPTDAASCYKTGMQLGFEVGGPADAATQGMLQDARSADLGVSRFILLNLGLYPGATSCLSTPNTSALPARPDGEQFGHHSRDDHTQPRGEGRECCIEYEMHNGAGWFRLAKAAILRNENSRRTTFELAMARSDLIGTTEEFAKRWKEGLRFGFSMLVNDGDDAVEQRGWGGYYPHGLVNGWNNGQKEPAKAGVVQFEGYSSRSMLSSGGGGGGGGGAGTFFLGVFLTLLGLAACVAYGKYKEGGVDAVKGMVPGLEGLMGGGGAAPTFMAGGGVSRGGGANRVNDSSHPSHCSSTGGVSRSPLASADFGGGGGYTAPLPQALPVAQPALVGSIDDLPMAAVVVAEP